jgi:hypothetical protein
MNRCVTTLVYNDSNVGGQLKATIMFSEPTQTSERDEQISTANVNTDND